MEKLVELSDHEVKIDFSLNCKCRTTVRIRSLTATCPVAFKVQTSSPHKFLVSPPSGLVPALSSATFQLILKPQSHLPDHFPRSPSDRFLVKTALAPDLPESTLPEFINSWFGSSPGPPTYDVKLGVAFVGLTLLRHAVGNGDVNAAKKIVKRQRGLVAELPAREAESLYRLASMSGKSDDMVSFLLDAGLKMEKDDDYAESKGWRDLHVAAGFDRTDEIVSLIAGGGTALLDCRDKEGRTPLMLAAEKGYEGCVRVLAGAGADMDARNKDGRTGLCRAVESGDRRMVEVLMELGADPTIGAGDHGHSALDVARDKGFKEVVDILEQGKIIMTATRCGDSSHLKRLLKRGASTSWHDQYGLTALHVAAMKGHKDIVKLLLELVSDLDCRDNEGHTPLHMAVEAGCIEIVEAFVDRKANLSSKSEKGATPLYIAKVMGYDDIYKFLSERGACN